MACNAADCQALHRTQHVCIASARAPRDTDCISTCMQNADKCTCLTPLRMHGDAQGKTQFHQKKECCAGALEGRLMKALVAITRAKNVLEVSQANAGVAASRCFNR